VFLYDYFFFLPTFFAAFFLAAMFITSDRFMEFHSAIFADGVIYLTDWLYEEMRGAGNDYFIDTFLVRHVFATRTPTKISVRRQIPLRLRSRFQDLCAALRCQNQAGDHRLFQRAASGPIGCGRPRHPFEVRHACSR